MTHKQTATLLSERIRQCVERSRLLPPEMAGPGDSEMEDWAEEVERLEARVKHYSRDGWAS